MTMNKSHIILTILFTIIFTKLIETRVPIYKNNIPSIIQKQNTSSSFHTKINTSTLRIISNKIHEHYQKLFEQKLFNGCVLVAIDGQIIYQNAFGYSDIKQKTCLNLNSLFQLASVSKILTATAIMKLYEKKLINIYHPVKEYIPNFPYPDINVYHLLTHTSGLPNYLHLMPDIVRQDTILSHHSVLEFLIKKKHRLEFKAGKRHKYCNTNYAVLACIIEKITGMSYSDFLKKEIFIPCQMSNTNTIYYIDIFDENTTCSHEYKSRRVPFYAGDFILGDKSIYSNIIDLFHFGQYFLNRKIIHDTTIRLMTKGVPTKKYDMLYGCGLRIKNYQDTTKTIWFHNGWWHGYRTSFQMRPKDKVIVIVLSNHIYKTTYFTHPIFETIDEVLYQQNTYPEAAHTHSVYPTLDEE